jgi:hypothetical protein
MEKINSMIGTSFAVPIAPIQDYGLRPDGTPKGKGFLGPHKMTDGSDRDMTEYSRGFMINGKETDVPTLIPTLNKAELDHLLAGKGPTPEIDEKARKHAEMRILQGKSPFAHPEEEGKYAPIPLRNRF